VLTDEAAAPSSPVTASTALDIDKKLQTQVQLGILDFTMPVMDGFRVFNE